MSERDAPVTDEDIEQLRSEAGRVRDPMLALLCGEALRGDVVARERVAKVITDARDADLMARFLAVKEKYTASVRAYQDAIDAVEIARKLRDEAHEALMDVKHNSLGDPTADDPLCCQRYGRVHMREFAVPGCRWFEAGGRQS